MNSIASTAFGVTLGFLPLHTSAQKTVESSPFFSLFSDVCLAIEGKFDSVVEKMTAMSDWKELTPPLVEGMLKTRMWVPVVEGESFALQASVFDNFPFDPVDNCLVIGLFERALIENYLVEQLGAVRTSDLMDEQRRVDFDLKLGDNLVRVSTDHPENGPPEALGLRIMNPPD